MNLEILTPEQKVFEGEASIVTFPGSNGSFQVMNDHAPLVATLTKGKIIVKDNNGKETIFEMIGGVVEIQNNNVAALVEESIA